MLRGQIALLIDDEAVLRGPGSYTLVCPEQRHTFWNPGDQPADYLTLVSPYSPSRALAFTSISGSPRNP